MSEQTAFSSYPSLETRMAVMEQIVADIRGSLLRLETRMESGFEKIDKRFEKIDERFDKIDARFEKMDAKIDRQLFLGIGAIVAVFATLAHALHWL